MTSKDIAMSLLSLYGLNKAILKPINSGLSASTILVSYEGEKYVFKTCNNASGLETEIKFCDFLKNHDLPVATIVKNNENQLISVMDGYSGALFNFCFGKEMGWGKLSSLFSENLAHVVARMHTLMVNNTEIPTTRRHGCKIDSVDGLTNKGIIRQRNRISDELKDLDFSGLREGLIHSDLTRQNILVTENGDGIDAIIDFGDAHFDYISWDIAVLIAHVFITKTYGVDWAALSVFIKKYDSLFPLTRQEKDVLIPFIKIRNINIAIEVNRLALNKNQDAGDLLSIENSVMTKIDIIEKNNNRLSEVLQGK